MEQTLDPTLEPAQLRALELLRRGRRFLILGHARPDGDCLGGQAALARVLAALGKDVVVLNPDPPEPRFEYLAQAAPMRTWRGGELPEHDVGIVVDFSELSRAGELGARLGQAPSKKLVVDHHIHEAEAWWDEAFVDPTASASGLLVYRIARALEVPLDAQAARAVFTSLVTDTGWFKYSNTDSETLAVASEMVRLGVEPSELYGALFQHRSLRQSRYVQELLSSVEYHADGRLALVRQPSVEAEDDQGVDSDDVLDILRSIETVEVVLYVRAQKDGTCKLSARSKTDYDVHALARRFGGGGHRKASGATLAGPLDKACAEILEAAMAGFEPVR
jgi:bifunctional oligoribonuclease and PAP phosphatase NrnA